MTADLTDLKMKYEKSGFDFLTHINILLNFLSSLACCAVEMRIVLKFDNLSLFFSLNLPVFALSSSLEPPIEVVIVHRIFTHVCMKPTGLLHSQLSAYKTVSLLSQLTRR